MLARKIKQHPDVHVQALGPQEDEVPTFSRKLAHEDGRIVSPTHRAPLRLKRHSPFLWMLEAESSPGP